MTETTDLSHFIEHLDDGRARINLAVEGMTCAACMLRVEGGLTALPNVTRARVNLTNGRVAVEWREGAIDPAAIVGKLTALGYRAYPYDTRRVEAKEQEESRFLLRCLGVAAFASMNVMLLSVSVWSGNATDITPEQRDFFHWLSALIALPAAAYAGQPFFRSAIRALMGFRLNMDVPITLGVVLALALSVFETLRHAEHAYFDSAVMLLTFLLAGRYLDQNMRRRTRAVAANLAALKAETAVKFVSPEEIREVPVAAIEPGDLVLVRPGERIAVDGEVIEGRSEIDQSLVTGETAHVTAEKGTAVYAGTLNINGTLRVRVGAAAEGTLLDEVTRLLDKAMETRSGYVRLAERAAQLYAPVVHLTALATMLGWVALGASWHDAIVTAIAVLIITCPCALGLAIPAVQVVASGALFRTGVLLNSGDAIERLAGVDTVVFDKTGTLTLPEPEVVNAADIPADVLALAGRLALASRHPLAGAVARAADATAPLAGAIEEPGQGVRATLDGVALRLGRPSFCGSEADGGARRRNGPGSLHDRLLARRGALCVRRAPAHSRRCRRNGRAHEGGRLRGGDPVGRSAGGGSSGGAPLGHCGGASRGHTGRQDCAYRAVEARRAQRADGRRRHQRRAGARRRERVAFAGDGRASHPVGGGCGVPRRPPRAGRHRARHRQAGEADHVGESVARGGLQCDRGADRDPGLRDAADRCAGDVRLVHPGHHQFAARAYRRSG